MQSLKKIIQSIFFAKANPHNNLTTGKSFEEKYNELGVFQYFEDGFSVQYDDFYKKVLWSEITELNVYKADLMTIDRIEMKIVYGEKGFVISEDLPGWYQFVLKIKLIYPVIPEDWEDEIVHPPFATNWRNIYKKIDQNNL